MKTIIALVTICLCVSSWAFVQELVLYDTIDGEGGSSRRFVEPVPDTDVLGDLINSTKRICYTGDWAFFKEPNYETYADYRWGREMCVSMPFYSYDVRSFRFLGGLDTEKDSISLYTGTTFGGEEISVQGTVQVGIEAKIISLATTGRSHWTLYEGTNLNGKFFCLWETDREGASPYFNVQDFGLSTVGSVLKGCSQ